jgi:hypothetical protein
VTLCPKLLPPTSTTTLEAQIALELLEAMRDQHDDPKFREFARALLPEIQEDDDTLRSINEKIGGNSSKAKMAAGWLLEKAARLKLLNLAQAIF